MAALIPGHWPLAIGQEAFSPSYTSRGHTHYDAFKELLTKLMEIGKQKLLHKHKHKWVRAGLALLCFLLPWQLLVHHVLCLCYTLLHCVTLCYTTVLQFVTRCYTGQNPEPTGIFRWGESEPERENCHQKQQLRKLNQCLSFPFPNMNIQCGQVQRKIKLIQHHLQMLQQICNISPSH